MGAVAGIFAKQSIDATQLIEDMLGALQHRGTQRTANTTETRNGCSIGIGYCDHDKPELHFAESRERIFVIDGSFFTRPTLNQAARAARMLGSTLNQPKNFSNIMSEAGAFAILDSSKNSLHAFRDMAGFKPLFYAHNRRLFAYASERKALWRVGFANVQRIPPSILHTISSGGITETILPHFTRSKRDNALTMSTATSRLKILLRRAIRRITWRQSKIAVAFSGGLDSSITAALAKEAGVSVELIAVGLSGSTECRSAEAFANQMGLPLTLQTYDSEDLQAYVRRTVWLIEEPSLMKVSVAVPLSWAAQVAANRGYRVMLCGQGSDELYGGYAKFTRTLDTRGRRALESELYSSVKESYMVNYERDDQATAPSGIELRTLFTDSDLVRFSLTIPSELLVKSGNDVMRKWVLRAVGQNMGLPNEIAWRRKKAIQHGTGVENAIRKLAKQGGLNPDVYLSSILEEVRGMDKMP